MTANPIRWRPEPGGGWQAVEDMRIPPPDATVEFHSIWHASPFFAKWGELSPYMNVVGLYWRPP